MASIYKRARDAGKRRAPWYLTFTDHTGKRRTRKGFTDKAATEQFAAQLEHDAMLRRRGLIDAEADRLLGQRQLDIQLHLAAFERHLQANSPGHVRLTLSRVRKIIDGGNIETTADLSAEIVQDVVRDLRVTKQFGCRTYNHYLQAVDSFGNWLVSTKRTAVNPVRGMKRLNAAIGIRHRRRALTPDEFSRLVGAALDSRIEIQCFSPEQRTRIYILSALTGLRRKELASLTARSFDLEAATPTVTVQAACSKHRKLDVLPLHPDLTKMLRNWLADLDPHEFLFPKLAKRRTWLMVKLDLERAGIAYETDEGIADFHAAGRHTYITELLRSGATVPEARELARHSDVNMTMRYTHIGLQDQARAVAALSVPQFVAGPAASAAKPAALPKQRRQRIGSAPDSERRRGVSSIDTSPCREAGAPQTTNPATERGYDADSQSVSSIGKTAKKWRRRESNPRPVTFPRQLLRA